MPLTPAQLVTFKAAILANASTIPAGQPWTGSFAGVQVKDVPNTPDGNTAVAGWYNQTASPSYLAWNRFADRATFRRLVVLSQYTPSDSVPATGSTVQVTNDAMLYANRAFLAQLKQANLMFVAAGDGSMDASDGTLRTTLQDCMRAIPTGSGGSNNDAGWGTAGSPNAARLSLMRAVTFAEKLFCAAGSGTGNSGGDPRGGNTNPDVTGFEGPTTASEVNTALNLA